MSVGKRQGHNTLQCNIISLKGVFLLARLCDVVFYNTNPFLVKVRGGLLVTKDIGGDVEFFIYDANTLIDPTLMGFE